MSCERYSGEGYTIFVCSRGRKPKGPRCSEKGCEEPAPYLCGHPIKPRQRRGQPQTTCDRRLCEKHRVVAGDDHDHCPFHASERTDECATV